MPEVKEEDGDIHYQSTGDIKFFPIGKALAIKGDEEEEEEEEDEKGENEEEEGSKDD